MRGSTNGCSIPTGASTNRTCSRPARAICARCSRIRSECPRCRWRSSRSSTAAASRRCARPTTRTSAASARPAEATCASSSVSGEPAASIARSRRRRRASSRARCRHNPERPRSHWCRARCRDCRQSPAAALRVRFAGAPADRRSVLRGDAARGRAVAGPAGRRSAAHRVHARAGAARRRRFGVRRDDRSVRLVRALRAADLRPLPRLSRRSGADRLRAVV